VAASLARWWAAVLLGIATIGAYGTAYYSIGVLIPVIAESTGWSIGALAGGFSLGLLGQGALSLFAGHVFDTVGSRPVMLASTIAGGALLLGASFAESSLLFTSSWSAGAAFVGGGLYYNMTMPITASLYPTDRVAAFSVLTLLGALASPIFYPVTAWLTEAFDWRTAIRADVALMVLCVLPAALLVCSQPVATAGSPARGHAKSWLAALRQREVQWTFLVLGLAAFASSSILVHQVTIMGAAGLSLAAASGFAGARGGLQIAGRLMLSPLADRLGVTGTMAVCYGLGATATLALLAALAWDGSTALLVYFVVVSGVALGLLSPLNGLFQAEVYGEHRLGTLSGVTVMVVSAAGAGGAAFGGFSVERLGGFEAMLAVAICAQLCAFLALRRQRSESLAAAVDAPMTDTPAFSRSARPVRR
jgi:MFS family permease